VKESFIAQATEEAGEVFKVYADLLQKRLKYGLPNQECIAYFEAGFSERVIAQALSDGAVWETAKTVYDARKLAQEYPDDFETVLRRFPSYFADVFRTITAP
jgi:POLQ-like helicase